MGSRGRVRPPDAELDAVLRALVRPLRDRLEERRLSRADLARLVMYDRSGVSRALSGRELPPLHLVERIAVTLDMDIVKARRRWVHADAIRRRKPNTSVRQIDGDPPDDLHSYAAFLHALRDLLNRSGLSHRELVHRDQSGTLRRSTIGAVLRGERTAQLGMVAAILRCCDVSDAALASWAAAWWRLGQPHQAEQHRRRLEGLTRRNFAKALDAWVIGGWR